MAQTITAAQQTALSQLYVAFFNRAADSSGLGYWANDLLAGKSIENIAQSFYNTEAARPYYTSGQTAEQFIDSFYSTVLGRAADADGKAYWVAQLKQPGQTQGSVAVAIVNAVTSYAGTDAAALTSKTLFNAKVEVSTAYAVKGGSAAGATGVLSGVVDAATAATAIANLGSTIPSATTGSTFTLTDKVGEVVTGTANNDTFSAVQGDATGAVATSTLNLGDTIDGGAGTDTLNLLLTGLAAGAFPAGASVKNVEIVNLVHTNDALTIGANVAAQTTSANYAGITQLWQTDNDKVATGTFADVTVGAGVTAGFRSTNANATAAIVTTAVAIEAASATQTAISVAVDGILTGSDLNIGGAGVKTVTVTGSVAKIDAATVGALNIDAADTIVETLNLGITSGANLTFSTVTTLKTIDASSSTGNLTVAIDSTAQTGLTAVKLGTGNDTLNFTFGSKTVAIDAGAGNDTVTLLGTVGATTASEITLGAGKDTVIVDAALANLGGGVATVADLNSRLITIKDFSITEDVLNFAAQGKALTGAQLSTIKASADLLVAATAAVAIANGATVAFTFGTDTYVLSDNGTAAALDVADALIKIVGIDATALTSVQNGNLVF